MKLTRQNFEKAEVFIKEKARPLEKALFDYYFNSGSTEEVLQELAKYQNPDGGFGHALESDVRLEASNCFTTSVAFQVLNKLNADSKNNLVRDGIRYLVNNYHPEFKGWMLFPQEVDDVPRAIWWNYVGNEENKYNPNPSAEIAGYLAAHRELVPENLLNEAVEAAVEYINEYGDNIEMHEMFCYQRMAECLDEEKKKIVMSRLKGRIYNVVEFDPEKWSNYSARPLNFIHTPFDEIASEINSEKLEINLDYLIKEQQEDGRWAPRWNWCRFEEQWKEAEVEWAGCLTLENLSILKAFNRIEE